MTLCAPHIVKPEIVALPHVSDHALIGIGEE